MDIVEAIARQTIVFISQEIPKSLSLRGKLNMSKSPEESALNLNWAEVADTDLLVGKDFWSGNKKGSSCCPDRWLVA